MKRLAIVAVLIVLAACVTPAARTPRNVTFERARYHRAVHGFVPLGTLWFEKSGRPRFAWGSGVAIGPRTFLTLGHCLGGDRVGCSGYLILNRDGNRTGHLIEGRPDDDGASACRVFQKFDDWIEVGVPEEGWAIVATLAGDYNVRLANPPDCHFWGGPLYIGASGSPVIQNGRVVGLFQALVVCQKPDHGKEWIKNRKRPAECRCEIPAEGYYAPLGDLTGLR